jgi:hypothetical protein
MKGAFANTKETFVIHDDFFTPATDLCDFRIQLHIGLFQASLDPSVEGSNRNSSVMRKCSTERATRATAQPRIERVTLP